MHSELCQLINSNVSGADAQHEARECGDDVIFVSKDHILPVCEFLKAAQGYEFNVLQVVTGCDYSDRIEVSYVLASFLNNLELILKVKLPKENSSSVPPIESVTSVWKAANYQERECYDMVGVNFTNHPDPRRILCPDDWEGYPLRQDYKVAKTYNGMEINPEHKINSADIYFGEKLKSSAADPKKFSYSWKRTDFFPGGGAEESKSE